MTQSYKSNYTTACSSGGAGDLIYSIQALKALSIKRLYIKKSFYPEGEGDLYSSMKELMELQGFEIEPTDGSYPMYEFDPAHIENAYNLDLLRYQPERHRLHIIKNYFDMFGLRRPHNWNLPWLKLDDKPSMLPPNTTLVHVTWRWRENSLVNWHKIVRYLVNPMFVGLKDDHEMFCKEIEMDMPHFKTATFFDLARAIRDCKCLYSNQGSALVLAQSQNKLHYLERKPGKTNTLVYTRNEIILR